MKLDLKTPEEKACSRMQLKIPGLRSVGRTDVSIAQTAWALSVAIMTLYLIIRAVRPFARPEKYPWLTCERWMVVGCNSIAFARHLPYLKHTN